MLLSILRIWLLFWWPCRRTCATHQPTARSGRFKKGEQTARDHDNQIDAFQINKMKETGQGEWYARGSHPSSSRCQQHQHCLHVLDGPKTRLQYMITMYRMQLRSLRVRSLVQHARRGGKGKRDSETERKTDRQRQTETDRQTETQSERQQLGLTLPKTRT
ncbi:unnamed protein product [Ectocarpus sp. 12 AP-2014]